MIVDVHAHVWPRAYVQVFGRLAPGSSMDDARTEIGVIGARVAAANPETHKHLRLMVSPCDGPAFE